jgi:hypothetical protein
LAEFKQVGTREMIELLLEGRRLGYDRLQQAVELALEAGSSDAAAVRYLIKAAAERAYSFSASFLLASRKRPVRSRMMAFMICGWPLITSKKSSWVTLSSVVSSTTVASAERGA